MSSTVRAMVWNRLGELGIADSFEKVFLYLDANENAITLSDSSLVYQLDEENGDMAVKDSNGATIDVVCPFVGCETKSVLGRRCDHIREELRRVTELEKLIDGRPLPLCYTEEGIQMILDDAAKERGCFPREEKDNHVRLCKSLGQEILVDYLRRLTVSIPALGFKSISISGLDTRYEYLICGEAGCNSVGIIPTPNAVYCLDHQKPFAPKPMSQTSVIAGMLALYEKVLKSRVAHEDIDPEDWKLVMEYLWKAGDEGYLYETQDQVLHYVFTRGGVLRVKTRTSTNNCDRYETLCLEHRCQQMTRKIPSKEEKLAVPTTERDYKRCLSHQSSERKSQYVFPPELYGTSDHSMFVGSSLRGAMSVHYGSRTQPTISPKKPRSKEPDADEQKQKLK